MSQEAAIRNIIRARAIARAEREAQQRTLIENGDIWHETVRAKLAPLNYSNQFFNFTRCGNEDFFRTCKCCGAETKFRYQCSIKWCPRCNWKISARRKTLLEFYTAKITQPKHLILTQKNFAILTGRRIRKFTKALAALRRTKLFEPVNGGCASIEITNEGKGWHLHAHLLLDVRFLDIQEVARVWGRQVGQEYGIVHIRDVREKSYLQEICKYVVEGSELAKWPADQINEFVQAVRGKRFFFSFGSLLKMAPEIRREIAANKEPSPVCECGNSDFIFRDQLAAEVAEILRLERQRSRRPVASESRRRSLCNDSLDKAQRNLL